MKRKIDAVTAHLTGQQIVSVEIEWHVEGCPGGNAQMAQAQLGVDEVEIAMEAFSGVGFEKSLAAGFVVSGFETDAGFQSGENVDPFGHGSARLQYFGDAIFLAEVGAFDVIDL